MRKKLLLYLLLSLISSIVLTGFVFFIWCQMKEMGFEERQAMTLFLLLVTVFQNLCIAIFSLPILLQIDNTNYCDQKTRLLYLIASPVLSVFIFGTIFYMTAGTISIAFFIPAIFFCSINGFLFAKLKSHFPQQT